MRVLTGRLIGLFAAVLAMVALGSSAVASADTGIRGGDSGSVGDSGYTQDQLEELWRQAVLLSNSPAAKAEVPLSVKAAAKQLAAQGKLPQGVTVSSVSSANTALVLDAKTGKLVGLRALEPSVSTMATNIRNYCAAGDGCYYGRPPTLNYGFYGSGTTRTGTWSSRYAFESGSHSVKACWGSSLSAVCSGTVGPGNTVVLSATVTGVSWTNYT